MRGVRALPPSIAWPAKREQSVLPHLFLASASRFTRPAYESVETKTAPEKSRGYFTTALLTGLRGRASQKGDGVMVGELKTYLELETQRLAALDGVIQHAHVVHDIPSRASVVFGRAKGTSGARL